mgnify:CR=1 FL=1
MTEGSFKQSSLLGIRKMFVVALIAGVLGICLPQFFAYPEYAVVLPLLAMVLYTGYGYALSADSIFIEQFADSVYYLGFLLTLVALVLSLYFYQGDTLDSGLLVANFSLALLTTIFGLAVRIYINNFQIEVHGAERHVMSGVEQAANELVKKAKLISMQLDVSHQETQAAIRQSVEHATEGMYQTALNVDKHAKISSETLHKNMQHMNQTVVDAVATLQKNLLNIKLPDEIFSEQLTAPLDRLVHRLNESQLLLKELNVQQSSISQNAQGIVEKMGNAMTEVEILAHSMDLYNNKLNANTKINDDLGRAIKEMSLLSKSTAQITENLERQSDQSTLVLNNFSKLANSSGQMSGIFESIGVSSQVGVKIASDLDDISTALANSRETVKEISSFGIHVISSFKRMETFNQIIDEHTQLLKSMGDVAKTDIDLAKQYKTEMASVLQQSRESLALMQQGLAKGISDSTAKQEKT